MAVYVDEATVRARMTHLGFAGLEYQALSPQLEQWIRELAVLLFVVSDRPLDDGLADALRAVLIENGAVHTTTVCLEVLRAAHKVRVGDNNNPEQQFENLCAARRNEETWRNQSEEVAKQVWDSIGALAPQDGVMQKWMVEQAGGQNDDFSAPDFLGAIGGRAYRLVVGRTLRRAMNPNSGCQRDYASTISFALAKTYDELNWRMVVRGDPREVALRWLLGEEDQHLIGRMHSVLERDAAAPPDHELYDRAFIVFRRYTLGIMNVIATAKGLRPNEVLAILQAPGEQYDIDDGQVAEQLFLWLERGSLWDEPRRGTRVFLHPELVFRWTGEWETGPDDDRNQLEQRAFDRYTQAARVVMKLSHWVLVAYGHQWDQFKVLLDRRWA